MDILDHNVTAESQEPTGVVVEYLTNHVIVGLVTAIGILTSIPLLILPVFSIMRRPVFVALSSWSLASILLLCTLCSNTTLTTNTWKGGEFWCKAANYLTNTLSFTRIYLLLVFALFAVLGEDRCRRWAGTRPWLMYVIPLVLTTTIWILIFPPAIKYFEEARYITLNHPSLVVCVITQTSAAKIAQIVLRFAIPMFLLFVTLMCWGFCQIRRKTISQKDKPSIIILFLLTHVYLVTHFGLEVLLQFPLESTKAVVEDRDISNYLIGYYIWLSEYVISPVICISIMIFYRHTILSKEEN